METTFVEVLNWAEEMERVRAALVLKHGEFPSPSALCRSFDRAPMSIWRELLRRSSELLDQSGHAAIDAIDRCSSCFHMSLYAPEYRELSLDPTAVRARAWYRQFREVTLTAAVYNVEQAVKQ